MASEKRIQVRCSLRRWLGYAAVMAGCAYLYAKSIVIEYLPRNSSSADRLRYLALLCGSRVVAIPISTVLTTGRS